MIPQNANARPVSEFRPAASRRARDSYTPAEIREIEDRLIESLDAECRPHWLIAEIFGLSERQLYRRLKSIRKQRKEEREMVALAI